MKKYVVVIVFDGRLENVLLVRKMRPEWQKGLLNGPGGSVEDGESFLVASRRELSEETGLTEQQVHLEPLVRIQKKGEYDLGVFCGRLAGKPLVLLPEVPSTGEALVIRNWNSLSQYEVVPDLSYLVPLAYRKLTGNRLLSGVTMTLSFEELP